MVSKLWDYCVTDRTAIPLFGLSVGLVAWSLILQFLDYCSAIVNDDYTTPSLEVQYNCRSVRLL